MPPYPQRYVIGPYDQPIGQNPAFRLIRSLADNNSIKLQVGGSGSTHFQLACEREEDAKAAHQLLQERRLTTRLSDQEIY